MLEPRDFPLTRTESNLLLEGEFLDTTDSLAFLQLRFTKPYRPVEFGGETETLKYLDGNSLGALSQLAKLRVEEALAAWGEHAVSGWTQGEEPWYNMDDHLRALMSRFVGGSPHEIAIEPNTTVALFQGVTALYDVKNPRSKIIINRGSFPTDSYIIHNLAHFLHRKPQDMQLVIEDRDEVVEEDEIIEMIRTHADEAQMLLWPVVDYRTGQLYDVARLTKVAHEYGISVVFDAAHSFGIVPHEAAKWDIDAMAWCGYKYGNGSAGTVAGLFVPERHHDKLGALGGWFASDPDKQFDMSFDPSYASDARRFQTGTLPILSAAASIGALEELDGVSIEAIRNRSLQQTDYLTRLIDTQLSGYGFRIVTPREQARRGGHIALAHPSHPIQINEALKAQGVIPDYRPPFIVRLAPAVYTSYREISETVQILKSVMINKDYLLYSAQRGLVA